MCTQVEIASFFRVSVSTINRLAATPAVRNIIDRGADLGRISIRRQQFKLLRGGSVTMAIWLGKQYLGQRDHLEHALETPGDLLLIEAEAADREQALLLSELFEPHEITAAYGRLQELELRRVEAKATDNGQTTKAH
jgi:hypothetical protein